MWQFIALLLTVCGAALFYLTNRHQTFISNPLPKLWRLLAFIFSLLALFFWLQLYVTSSALFTWLFTSCAALICIPLLGLNKKLCRAKGDI
ncbi:hypothetical protein A9Q75_06610 [Colwellia psychrerythraea]|uniref:Uncharacterized protein n=1 Tax=Colwellia psychrerythraea TaxID=28229 RepID=A0A1Y5EHZ0_COLPS|nr:hypothetical protein A9Q75_06610 [Colwellia psychrerythraea]